MQNLVRIDIRTQLGEAFPSRNAANVLSERLVRYLQLSKLAVGTKLLTDADLVSATRLSHSTVRRALQGLQREGWIERRAGHGSLVGPRVAMSTGLPGDPPQTKTSLLRIAVVATFSRSDWYVAGVLDALDRLASSRALNIELISAREDAAPEDLSRRLAQSRPDVLAMIAPRLPQARVVADAARLGIPCIATGAALDALGIFTVCEDSVQGAAMAVERLARAGHRQIGLIGYAVALKWVFSRRAGWRQGMIDHGLDADENLVCWLPEGTDGVSGQPYLAEYFRRRKPSAVVCTSSTAMRRLGDYCQASGMHIPRDLSVVSFDQDYQSYQAHFGRSDFRPDVVALPLQAIGQAIADAASQLSYGQMPPSRTDLQCELIQGNSVLSLSAGQK